MKFYFALISLTSLFLLALSVQSQGDQFSKDEKILNQFNKGLEIIEIKLRNSDYNSSCYEALKMTKLIDNEYIALKATEPNYAWEEIRQALNAIPVKYCPDLSK